MPKAGETYYLPPRPSGDVLPDPDSHPHTLARDCVPGQTAHLFFGSTSPAESRLGAAFRAVRPVPDRRDARCNGLSAHTFIYPGVVVALPSLRLPSRAGRIGPEWRPILRACRMAWGIGTFSSRSGAAPRGSLRGRIVRLGDRVQQKLFTSSYLVLTEHAYSTRRRYQTVLPIYPATGRESGSPERVVIREKPWIGMLGPEVQTAQFLAPLLFSVWEGNAGLAATGSVVDDESLTRVEAMLCAFFRLPE